MQKPASKIIYADVSSCEISPLSAPHKLEESEEFLLIGQIKQRGELIEPCYAVEYKGLCQVFLGAHQLTAYKKALPGKKIPVLIGVTGQFTPKEITALQLCPAYSPNEESYDGSYLAKAEIIHRLRKHYNFSDQDIADHANLNRATVSQIRRLPSLHSTVRRHLRTGSIGFSIAREMLSVDKDKQLDLISEIVKKGMNITQARKLLKGTPDINQVLNGNKSSQQLPNNKPPSSGSNSDTGTTGNGYQFLPKTADVRTLENQINDNIGYPVSIDQISADQGSISIRPFDHLGVEAIADYIGKEAMKHRVRIVIDYDTSEEFDSSIANMVKSEDEWD